jgi:transposase
LPLLSRKEKEKFVINLAKEGKTTREIAKIVHISLKDIGKIINRETGDAEVLSKEEKEKEKQKRLKSISSYAQAFQMFRENKTLSGIVVELDLDANTVLDYHGDYLRLVRMNSLLGVYKDIKDDFPLFLHLYKRIKKEGLFPLSTNLLLFYKPKYILKCEVRDLNPRSPIYLIIILNLFNK